MVGEGLQRGFQVPPASSLTPTGCKQFGHQGAALSFTQPGRDLAFSFQMQGLQVFPSLNTDGKTRGGETEIGEHRNKLAV